MNAQAPHNIGIIGTGAWGTALAQALRAETPCDILLYGRQTEVTDAINQRHENTTYLPGVKLHAGICGTSQFKDLRGRDILLLVTPAQHLRTTLQQLRTHDLADKPLVICAKGVELGTGLLMSQVAEQEIPGATIAILTGPTFAADIARGKPSAFTLAARDHATAEAIRDRLTSRSLRPYVSDDLIGAQVGGAVKNVIAIACGIIMGLNLGESARAALMTRGVAEIARLTKALGGKRETLMGLCGIGDLMLTCTSDQSRNYSLGLALGKGQTLDEILGPRRAVTEGVHTAKALTVLAAQYNVDMPISLAMNQVLNEGLSIAQGIASLQERPLRPENV